MSPHGDSLSRFSTLIAGLLSLLIGLLIPSSYYLVSYQYMVGSMDAQAGLSARAIEAMVAANPRLWQYEEIRMQGLLERRLDASAAETQRIRDPRGNIVAQMAEPLRRPVVTRRHDILDVGRLVAHVEITRSLLPLLTRTAAVGAASLLLAGFLFYVFRIVPMRMVRHSRRSLEESERRYRSLYESMHEGVALHRIVYDGRGTPVSFSVLDVNRTFEALFGVKREELAGKDGAALCAGAFMEHFPMIARAVAQGEPCSFEMPVTARNRVYHVSVFPSEKDAFATLVEDVTDRLRSEEKIRQLAFYDTLTGLPNRFLALDRLHQAMSRALRNQGTVALLFLDIDHFKNVNDTLGHAQGDLLLVEVAQRLVSTVRKEDTVARLGGDEFVIIVSYGGEETGASYVARNLLASFSAPFTIAGRELFVSASIGIAVFPDDSGDVQALLKCADLAMYAAKEGGRRTFRYYSAEMNRRAYERMEIETTLRRALQRGEFFLAFHPIVSTEPEGIVGAEALLRWQDPQAGLVMPASFIAAAEESGLIVPIGEWVLRTVCRRLRDWRDAGRAPVPISVNVSGRQLDQGNLVETVEGILASTGADPRLLEIELTESSLMRNPDAAIRTLRRLKQLGLSIVVDDFGTGYSSLGHLKTFPIDRLKIDRSFVGDVCVSANDRAIVEAIIAMADKLGLQVVAEGVETAEQARFLHGRGCHRIQGFLYHRPLDEGAFLSLLEGSRDFTPAS